jgi:hypothetical protein
MEYVEWSCSFIIPKHIRILVEQMRSSQIDLLQYGIPWMYPFHFAAKQKNEIDLAKALASAFLSIRSQLGGHNEELQRIQWENPDPTKLVTAELPRIVTRLMTGKIPATKSPIAGVSIISTIPINELPQEYRTLPVPLEPSLEAFGSSPFDELKNAMPRKNMKEDDNLQESAD